MNHKFITKIILNIFALLIVSYLIPGFHFTNIVATVITAIVIGMVNSYIKPIFQIIFLPLSIITLGVAAFLINVLLLLIVSYIVPGFDIENFMTAVISSIALTLISMFLNKILVSEEL